MSDPNADFGAKLRAQRESRGITLDALAASMKIQRSLLADLEQNDLSRWPHGIYRRAFIRQYAMLVGLPPEGVLQQFYGLFPEPREPQRRLAAPAADSSELRLTLEDGWSLRRWAASSRVVDVVGMLGFVLATGGVLALMTGLAFWTVSGVVALIWYPLASAVYGGEVSIRRVLRITQGRRAPSRAADAPPLDLYIGSRQEEGAMQTFEGHDAERDEEHGLPLTTSRQVH